MEDKDFLNQYLENYEQNLTQNMLRYCTSAGYLDGKLLETPDLDEKWESIATPYMGDAMKEIVNYPAVALGWMMYVGMAMATFWDGNWEAYARKDNIYEELRDLRGFDCMDEAIRDEILGLSGADYQKCEDLVRGCSNQVLNAIYHEKIAPQSAMAFHVYVRSIHVLYKIGAAVQLKNLGYKFEKV